MNEDKNKNIRENQTNPKDEEQPGCSCSGHFAAEEHGPQPQGPQAIGTTLIALRTKTMETNKHVVHSQDASTDITALMSNRDPMFVIVDSSDLSTPSSREVVVPQPMLEEEAIWKKYISKNIMFKSPIDVPSTSHPYSDFTPVIDIESREEMQMIDINLQSENEIAVESDCDNDSIVVSYLRDRDKLRIEAKNKAVKQPPSTSGTSKSLSPSKDSRNAATSPDIESNVIAKLYHEDSDLLIAAELGDDEKLAKLIRSGANLHETDYLSRNALHMTVCTGNIRAVKLLLQAGLSPNIKDSLSRTPLSLCLFRKPSVEIVHVLFEHGAKLVRRSCASDTGLFLQFIMMCKPTTEEINIIKILLDKGASLEDPEAPAGRQALHFAAFSNNTVLIQALVDLGANLFIKNHRNQTPKDVAIAFKCREALYCLEDIEFSSLFDNKRGSKS